MSIKNTPVQVPEDCDIINVGTLCNPSGVQYIRTVPVGAGAVFIFNKVTISEDLPRWENIINLIRILISQDFLLFA